MDLTIGNIIVGGFISLIGMALILYGRKELRVPHDVTHVALKTFGQPVCTDAAPVAR